MNGKDNGYCRTEKSYNVPENKLRQSELTEENGKFTCIEMEVFKVIFL